MEPTAKNPDPHHIFIDEVQGHQRRWLKVIQFTSSATKAAAIMLAAAIVALVIANSPFFEPFVHGFQFVHHGDPAQRVRITGCCIYAAFLETLRKPCRIDCRFVQTLLQIGMHCRIAAADAVGYRQNKRHIRYLFRCFFLFEESEHACPHLSYRLLFFRMVQCPCKQTAAQKRCHAQNRTLQVELHHLRHLPEQQKLTVQIPQQNR